MRVVVLAHLKCGTQGEQGVRLVGVCVNWNCLMEHLPASLRRTWWALGENLRMCLGNPGLFGAGPAGDR